MHGQFSVAWDSHTQNICNGLTALQQNGEFVDMTVAAAGHYVKVHQMVMSLASPYMKELILAAQCPHPVIFINKISYATLCALLEYIYVGKVLVPKDSLEELILVAKELRVKGLEEMSWDVSTEQLLSEGLRPKPISETVYKETVYKDSNRDKISKPRDTSHDTVYAPDGVEAGTTAETESETPTLYEHTFDDTDHYETDHHTDTEQAQTKTVNIDAPDDMANENEVQKDVQIQYTVTNCGRLQMILNRYLYYLRHTGVRGQRQWRCVDYERGKRCPATVTTKGDTVIHRTGAHTHTFHDKKIIKKVRQGAVFAAMREAENEGNSIKKQKESAKLIAKAVA